MPGQSLFAFQKDTKTLLKVWKGVRWQSVNAKLFYFFWAFFASAGGMGGTGGISSIEAVVERLEGCFNAVIGGLWDVVAALGHLEMAIHGVVLSGQAVWAKLMGLLSIVQERSENLLAAAKEATRAIVCLVDSVEVACENI